MYPSIPQRSPQLNEGKYHHIRDIQLFWTSTCSWQANNPDSLQCHSPQPIHHDLILFHCTVPHCTHLFCIAVQFIQVIIMLNYYGETNLEGRVAGINGNWNRPNIGHCSLEGILILVWDINITGISSCIAWLLVATLPFILKRHLQVIIMKQYKTLSSHEHGRGSTPRYLCRHFSQCT